MIKKIVLLLVIIVQTGCAQKKKKHLVSTEMEKIEIAPKEKQVTYAIHINAKTPYEIFVDDIPVERFYESGMNSTIELNQYLLKNGKHELKVRYLPRPDAEDGLLQPGHVYHSKDSKWNIFFVSFLKNPEAALGYDGEIDYVNSELEVIPPPEPVPFWEQVFELDITDLPYELEGWSNGKDLSDENREELKKKVLSFYKKIRNLLDNGNVDEFLALSRQKDIDIIKATYDDDIQWYASTERKSELISDCQGNMWPINEEDYSLKIYANGKLVALERVGKFKNKGLIAETESNYSTYSLKLYIPVGAEEFIIIRK